ncbi:MAG TPA: diguanylate cyclase [Rhodanobacteraceae bacterium]|nr:diguanylate cyclase [Rhodanobacteraceae bacterium]
MSSPQAMSSPSVVQPRHPLESTIRARLDHVLDMLVDAVCIVDPDGRFVYASAACERIFGYTPDEMIGRQMLELIHPEDRVRTLAAVNGIMDGTPNPHFENRYVRKDGSVAHIMWSARWSSQDGVRIAVARDITGRKRAEAVQSALLAISEAAHMATDLLDLFHQIHVIIGGLLPARNFFVTLYDRESDTLSFPYFVDEHDAAPAPMRFDSGTLSAEVIRSGEALLLTPDTQLVLPDRVGPIVGRESLDWLGVPLIAGDHTLGALVVQSYSGATRYTDQDKQLLQFVSAQVAAAIERKQIETRLRHIAQHDGLTDLPNRKLFDERLQAALKRAARELEVLALLYIDVDGFKHVNDNLGHGAGDRLLHEVAQRIASCVRETDTVGRMGGDEFVVLLTGVTSARQATLVAEKILSALRWPFELPEGHATISASIGIALSPEHGVGAQQLVREADRAMYAAKKAGGNRCRMVG